ncbi:uncharacterized protein [Nicotiana sylvestris]|uniref:uncharacterized protein n=1 Tax=Nicotiana sylvestris TaxID=4096 RepID=UPI00388CC951
MDEEDAEKTAFITQLGVYCYKMMPFGEDITEEYDGWKMFFDGAVNFKGVGIGVILVSEMGQHYPVSAKLRSPCTNNMAEYEACILGLNMAVDMNIQELLVISDSDLHVHQVQGEWAAKNSKIFPYLHHVHKLRKRITNINSDICPEFKTSLSMHWPPYHP